MKIRRSVGFTLLLLIIFTSSGWSQKEITINYFRPYQYDAAKNTVKAWIDQKDLGEDFTISLDGRTINYAKADSGRVELVIASDGERRRDDIYSSTRSGRCTNWLNSNSDRWYRPTGAISERVQ